MREISVKQLDKTLQSAGTQLEKSNDAADMFFGYYWLNTRSRAAYCQEQGIDISVFTTSFADAHSSEHMRASEIYKNAGVDEETIWSPIKQTSYKMAADIMQDIAQTYELTPL